MYEEREMSLEESFSNDISSQYSWLLQGLFSRRVLWVSLGTPYNMQLQKKKKMDGLGVGTLRLSATVKLKLARG